MKRHAVAVGTVVTCAFYSGSLTVQAFFPTVKEMLSVDLGGGAHPTYYARVGMSLAAGFLGAVVAQLAWTRDEVSEQRLAWATGLLVALAALVTAAFP